MNVLACHAMTLNFSGQSSFFTTLNVSFATLAAAYCMATVGDLVPSSLPNGVWYNKQSISSKKTHTRHSLHLPQLTARPLFFYHLLHCPFTTYYLLHGHCLLLHSLQLTAWPLWWSLLHEGRTQDPAQILGCPL